MWTEYCNPAFQFTQWHHVCGKIQSINVIHNDAEEYKLRLGMKSTNTSVTLIKPPQNRQQTEQKHFNNMNGKESVGLKSVHSVSRYDRGIRRKELQSMSNKSFVNYFRSPFTAQYCVWLKRTTNSEVYSRNGRLMYAKKKRY